MFEELYHSKVMKASFAHVFGLAFLCVFTEDTIKAAFSVTGVHPFDPMVISDKQMKLSLTALTKGSFPLGLCMGQPQG